MPSKFKQAVPDDASISQKDGANYASGHDLGDKDAAKLLSEFPTEIPEINEFSFRPFPTRHMVWARRAEHCIDVGISDPAIHLSLVARLSTLLSASKMDTSTNPNVAVLKKIWAKALSSFVLDHRTEEQECDELLLQIEGECERNPNDVIFHDAFENLQREIQSITAAEATSPISIENSILHLISPPGKSDRFYLYKKGQRFLKIAPLKEKSELGKALLVLNFLLKQATSRYSGDLDEFTSTYEFFGKSVSFEENYREFKAHEIDDYSFEEKSKYIAYRFNHFDIEKTLSSIYLLFCLILRFLSNHQTADAEIEEGNLSNNQEKKNDKNLAAYFDSAKVAESERSTIAEKFDEAAPYVLAAISQGHDVVGLLSTQLAVSSSTPGRIITRASPESAAAPSFEKPPILRTRKKAEDHALDKYADNLELSRAAQRLVSAYQWRRSKGLVNELSPEEAEQLRAARQLLGARRRRQKAVRRDPV